MLIESNHFKNNVFPQKKRKTYSVDTRHQEGIKRSTRLAIKQTNNVVASSDRTQGEMERKGMLIIFYKGKKGGD